MTKKTSSDYTEAQLRAFHGRLKAAATKSDRDVIYKEMGAVGQAVAQWFRRLGFKPLGAVGGSAPKKKQGRPAKAKAEAKTSAKAGRPKKNAENGPAVPKRAAKGTGLSVEAKEILIRLMDKLLSD